jgi:hypothetical protein
MKRIGTLENQSGFATEDLRRFLEKGLSVYGVRGPVDVLVTSSPIRSRGCAAIDGYDIVIAAAPPSYNATPAGHRKRLALLLRHECRHLEGDDHDAMDRDVLYSYGPEQSWAWARDLPLRRRGRAPNQLPRLAGYEGPRFRVWGGVLPQLDQRVSASARRGDGASARQRISASAKRDLSRPEALKRRAADRTDPSYYVYVIELRPLPGDPRLAVYVGSSALPPAERLRHHLGRTGDPRAASGIVRRRGVRLRPDLYEHLPVFHQREDAKRAEVQLRQALGRRGYRVYGR